MIRNHTVPSPGGATCVTSIIIGILVRILRSCFLALVSRLILQRLIASAFLSFLQLALVKQASISIEIYDVLIQKYLLSMSPHPALLT